MSAFANRQNPTTAGATDSINGFENTPSEENKTEGQSGEQDRTVIRSSSHRINEAEVEDIKVKPQKSAEVEIELSVVTNEEENDEDEEVAFATKSLTPSFNPGSAGSTDPKLETGKSKR